MDQLAAAERRSREYARRGETLLAGDIVFTEVRDVLADGDRPDRMPPAPGSPPHTIGASRPFAANRRSWAAAPIAWIAIALLLVTPTKAEPVKDPNAWRDELAQTIKKPVPKEPERTRPLEPLERLEPLAPLRPAEPSVSLRSVADVSEICADLSSLGDTGALAGALERAATVLGASGVIVWIASNDGNSLAPVASHGFDQKLVTRIGRIPRESANLTAAAFRENVPRVSAATSRRRRRWPCHVCGPSGPVGVLSVELKPDVPADDSRVALATIFAAQLATLANPIPSAPLPCTRSKVEQSSRGSIV